MACVLIGDSRTSASWPKRQETFQFAPGMPPLHTSQLPWNKAGAPEGQPAIFQLVIRNETKDLAEVIVCHFFYF
jgi:hypothetical protein